MTTATIAPRASADTAQRSDIAAVPLRMIRASVDIRAFHEWAGSRRMMRQSAFDPGYALHCLLTETFGDLAPKPFRLIVPRSKGVRHGTLYGYCGADAQELQQESAICACPLQARILPANRIDSKPMPTEWRVGKRLGFETLIRPVARCRDSKPDSESNRKGGKERDVFLHRVELQKSQSQGEDERISREAVYSDWLATQLLRHGGARLEGSAVMKSFQRTRIIRNLSARRSIEGPEAVMRGVLTITDAHAFNALLARGVGRHRAYGYGMLLLRPARA